MTDSDHWRLPAALTNAAALRHRYERGFLAISEFDRMGHLLLHRAGSQSAPADLEQIVGIALLRRAVSTFASIRALLESALADPARALARALFEIVLNHRCIAYGASSEVALETPTLKLDRTPRASRFFVASERRGLRSRAMLIKPGTRYAPSTVSERDALEKEMVDELYRLRGQFPAEWQYFGDCAPDASAIADAIQRDRLWFAAEWPANQVTTIGQMAHAYGYAWEYDYIYDAFSALVHARGVRHDVEFSDSQMHVRHPNDDAWFCIVAFCTVSWYAMLLITAAKWHAEEMIPQLQDLHRTHRDGIASLEMHELPPLLS